MTELKTLKDFEDAFNTGLSPAASQAFKELKQEAIKLVKEKMITSLIGDYTAKMYFMEFFNITEEDLK